MALRVRPMRDLAEFVRAVGAIEHYFGGGDPEETERFARLLPVDRMHGAFDGAEIVGGAGAIPLGCASSTSGPRFRPAPQRPTAASPSM